MQKGSAVRPAHREIAARQLEYLTTGAHPAERQTQLPTRSHRDLAVGAKACDRVGQCIQRARGPEHVCVVHDEDERSSLDAYAVDGLDKTIQQSRRVVISRIQVHPGEGSIVLIGPFGEHAGLRVAGRRCEEHERVIAGLAKARDEIWAAHITVVQGWDRHRGSAKPERIGVPDAPARGCFRLAGAHSPSDPRQVTARVPGASRSRRRSWPLYRREGVRQQWRLTRRSPQ